MASARCEKRAQGAGNTDCAALSYTGALDAKLSYDTFGRLTRMRKCQSGTVQSVSVFVYDGPSTG